jgi:exodeoxyribonuclease V gamma subunit
LAYVRLVLHVHRAEETRALVDAAAHVLTPAPADPFAPEVIAVPARGVERWIAQRLSHVLGDADGGVCANVVFPSPLRLLDDAVAAASPEHAAAVEAWAPDRMVWPLLEVVGHCGAHEEWCRQLGVHLGLVDGVENGRRWSVVRKLAALYASYGQSRPAMLRAWAGGADEDGTGDPLPDDLAWQAELWRRLRARLDAPHPAELLEDTCATLVEHPERVDLPERFSVFGATRLAPARLQVLAALAQHRDVHLFVHHPSPALWAAVEQAPPVRHRRDDATVLHHPLLRSLARDVRELQQLVRQVAPDAQVEHHPSPAPPDDLLGRLKADLAADRERPQGERPLIDAGDRSVQVHACHGQARQVEVLREVVLGLLEEHDDLEPRDILVMCPDIETFAPLIAASFGSAGESAGDDQHPAGRLRVRLADRALRQTNPLLAVLGQLLELGGSRATATQVLDVAGATPVRRRFGFDDEDVETLRAWVHDAGVRWGLSSDHRAAWSLQALQQGTWRAGLDRVLLGTAMAADDDWLGEAIPLEVDSTDVELAGRFAELLDRLEDAVAALQQPRTATGWVQLLEETVAALADVPPSDEWQVVQLQSELAEVAAAAGETAVQLTRGELVQLLEGRLAGRPSRASFRTGSLTVCTLVPMRSVPHRVVCLLGLDDGTFPRQGLRDGDDILLRDPWIGERDPRSEDRQLLLDAVLAAQDRLVITYNGADERTGAPVPPAVPLGELLDALDGTARTTTGRVRDAITVQHPLQPFDPACFEPGTLQSSGPFSHDAGALAGARAVVAERAALPPLLSGPLPPAAGDVVQLADLVRLLEHPARGFLRQRLGVALTSREEEPSDALPVELDPLEQWAIGDRLLQLRVRGTDVATCLQLERRRGALPPGQLGANVLATLGPVVEQLLQACETERATAPRTVPVDVPLPDGRRLIGSVPGVHGDTLLALHYSNLAAKHRLRTWVHLLALATSRPDRPWTAAAVGRDAVNKGRVRRCLYRAPGDAAALLGQLIGLYDAGLREPLPLPVKCAAEYARRRAAGASVDDVVAEVTGTWEGGFNRSGERADAEHLLVHQRLLRFTELLAAAPAGAEAGDGWDAGEATRFGRLAMRVWSPLLDAELAAVV